MCTLQYIRFLYMLVCYVLTIINLRRDKKIRVGKATIILSMENGPKMQSRYILATWDTDSLPFTIKHQHMYNVM